MKYLFSCVCILLLSVQAAFAQVNSNTFTIRMYGGVDATAPSTPTLLTATPITTSQIDLAWSASTDNYSVAGYNVFRDGTAIATTSLLSYSDTGLTASTTYAYTVRAFDPSYNYSSSSNTLATTTPDVYIPPTPTSTEEVPQQGTVARLVLDELVIDTGVSTTSLQLATARPTRIEIRWGRTASYELGYIVSNVYAKEHGVMLTDLEPGTTYEYEIVGYTPFGLEAVLKTGSFTTDTVHVVSAPENVSRFLATPQGDSVQLTWQLPQQENVDFVRIVRSHLGFPEHPQDGAIVYQGLGGSAFDEGVLRQYSPVYYTAFVYDVEGNVSSGAVVMVYAIDSTDPQIPITTGVGLSDSDHVPGIQSVVPEATSSVVTERLTPDMKMPELTDITITQGANRYSMLDRSIELYGEESFMISLPVEAVAGNLKTIVVSVLDPTDNRRAYSYLLRINRDRTAYEAVIPAVVVHGASQIKISIYDYEALVVGAYQTPVMFVEGSSAAAGSHVVFPDVFFEQPLWLVPLILLLLILILLLILVLKRSREREADPSEDKN
ncbi:MAG: fibronectin type III domain-containing protein [Candidatus Kaiserbacteria bacterium]|nr:fibronectin type III domain-containing protein [Candidatus Kaiserbacteria bacterium]MCB9816266.1 fibronectin type III domain-containing protein [Candidatus Nomurabacteria bacterium]